ncbi:MAG: hypothetical protein LAO56_03155 [Acidobacteriia bacterium]|nr:hypothetical protein [Terriglobia bacterium]
MISSLIAKWMILWLLLPSSVAGGTPPQATDQTRSPHGSLNIACQNCHTVYGWKPIRAVPEFDHNQTKFPLRGLHEGVNCVNCHTKMVFSNVGNKCADCHADIHRGKMSGACESCHTVRGWKVSVTQINMHMNRFPLTGAHAAASCEDCHKSGGLAAFSNMSTECLSCHRADFNKTTNPRHTAAAFFATQSCEGCHSTDSWLNAKFDHSVTGFVLTGMHATTACADCHKNNNYNLTAANTACTFCHQNDYNGTTNPNHLQQSQYFPPANCQNCHTTVGWSPANFDHSTTAFPLTGQHTTPPRACTDCHVNNNYNITVTTCVSCHLTDFNNTTNPSHVQGSFPQTCQTCHTTSAWAPANFDHSTTNFPLTGQHTVPPRACTDCHVNNNYNITVTTCVSCHQTDYNNAKTPVDHPGGNFPTTCENCHDTSAWTNGKFDHTSTGWALTGQHTVPPRSCGDCHTATAGYNITVTTCVSCHQNDYNTTNNPNHAQQGIATTCEICHTTAGWSPAQFDHAKSGFPLTGSHTVPPRACTDCHVNNNYNITDTSCVSCHQTDYNNAKTPVDHVGANFPTTCATCHDTVHWTDGRFDHASTGWALTNSHTVPPRLCSDCHTASVGYNITTTTCVSCHQTDYNNAKTPVDHVSAKFPLTCEGCHDTLHWTDGVFNHASTGWALTGSHMVPPRACADCHVNGNYNITTTTCVSCHQTDYNNALTPVNHPQANFPLTCDTCHDMVHWTDGRFDHASTGWALTNSHMVPPRVCTDCHTATAGYNISTTTCVSCHQTDYNNAKTPVDHVSAKFPVTCEGCHDTNLWTDGVFNHATTGWALTNSHMVPPRVCTDCHTASVGYNITTTTCVSCHQTDYNNAKTPVDHVTANFPLTCETCHDTIHWTDGVFNHASTGFTLTGMHTVPPRACTDCHTAAVGYNIPNAACSNCHMTEFNNTSSPPHTAVGFQASACASCHDTVAWTDATFNHNTTAFPLQGAHTTTPCTSCHVNNNYLTLPTDCYGCHQATYNNTTNPNHASAGFPTTCVTCHTTWVTTNWLGATFNHTYFPMNHGNANGVCATCHTNPNDYSVFQCTGCHGNNNAANFHHPNVNGYVYNSVNCYQCHKSGGGG